MTGAPGDHARVSELLGREPRGRYEVVVRDDTGDPVVLENAPLLDDGTPMPTRYWLVGEPERALVGRLESEGGVDRAEAEVDPGELAAAHARYAVERDAALPGGHTGPRPADHPPTQVLPPQHLAEIEAEMTRHHDGDFTISMIPKSGPFARGRLRLEGDQVGLDVGEDRDAHAAIVSQPVRRVCTDRTLPLLAEHLGADGRAAAGATRRDRVSAGRR